MARKKKADNPEQSQETPAKNTTEIHIPESGLVEETPSRNSDRESSDPGEATFKDDAREAIFARRKEFLEKQTGMMETGTTVTDPITENAAEESAQEIPETVRVSEPVAANTPPAAALPTRDERAEELPPQKYKIIVDGQPIEYTLEELQQQAQLGVGARKKFDEAAKMRQEAQNLIFASQQNSQPQAVNNQLAQPQLQDIPETELRDIAKRLNYGSEEEQAKALRDAISLGMNRGQLNQLTPDAIINVATQNALNVLSAQQEQEILKNEFKEIIADPAIAYATDFMANQLSQKYAALGQQKTRLELLREAGNMAKERYLKPATSQPNSSVHLTPTVVDMTNKIERKRTAPQPPNSANKVASSGDPQAYGVPSAQALDAARRTAFTDIARRRGQSA